MAHVPLYLRQLEARLVIYVSLPVSRPRPCEHQSAHAQVTPCLPTKCDSVRSHLVARGASHQERRRGITGEAAVTLIGCGQAKCQWCRSHTREACAEIGTADDLSNNRSQLSGSSPRAHPRPAPRSVVDRVQPDSSPSSSALAPVIMNVAR